MDDDERLQRREMIAALRGAITTPGHNNPEQVQKRRREALLAYMEAHNLNANGWAIEAGIRPTSVYNFINGYSKSMDDETYTELAAVMNTTAAILMGESDYSPAVGQAIVIGRVQAGNWQKAVTFVDEADTSIVPCVLPPHIASKGTRAPVFGLSVKGDSMDQVFPEGSVLICLPLYEMSGKVKDGDYVVVHRIDPDGLYEATCKQYRLVDGEMWLAPRSNNPSHMPIKGDNAGNGVQVEVVAVVGGFYAPMAAAARF
jgi:SOS-response transcriptional repressor LexA